MTDHTKVAAWYDKKYQETGDDTRRSIEAFFQLESLIPSNSSYLLDVGCGSGEFIEYLFKKGFQNIAAVDISEQAIKKVKELVPICDVRLSIGEKMPFDDEKFDAITCLGVLEHFLDIEAGISEMARVLKANGRIIIMVPNKNFIGWVFKKDGDKGTQQNEISETLHSVAKWKMLIENSGLKIKSTHVDKGFIYNNSDQRKRGIKYLLKKILFLLLPLIPLKYSYQVIFLAVKPAKINV